MNRCGNRAKSGALGQNINQKCFGSRSGRRFRESYDGQTKAAP